MRTDFAIFIVSNSRPNNVKTIETLNNCNNTNKIYIIVDDLDKTINEYRANFKDVIVFDKMKYYNLTDTFYNNTKPNQVTFARNAVFDIAKDLNLKYFWVLDDDIKDFSFRYIEDNELASKCITNLDKVLDIMIDYLEECNLSSLCFADDSFYFGGKDGDRFKRELVPGLYNSMLFKTDDRIWFSGNLNEDLITLLNYSKIGKLMFMYMGICNRLPKVSTTKGGNYDAYQDTNNYIKTWYHIIPYPGNIKLNLNNYRPVVGHKNLYPKIISDKFKKKD